MIKVEKVALTLYTVRDYLKTPEAIRKTLEKVRKIGYTAVQISSMGPIAESNLKSICDDLQLTICATHEPAEMICNQPEKIVERLQKLDCKYTAYPFPHLSLNTRAQVDRLVESLDRAGQVLYDAGKVLCYHNHDIEFKKIDNERILDRIYCKTNARYLQGEPDTFWIQAGGDDPVAWCKRLSGRMPLIHLKDLSRDEDRNPCFEEIGAGGQDFFNIVRQARASGCEWFIVEQDNGFINNDPFLSAANSFEYIQKHLVDAD